MVVERIGRYLVERELGRGGMAVVYLARQPDLDRLVALKEIAGVHASDPTAVSRFLREAQLTGSLSHPNIVVVHEFFEHEGLPYIAMEYLPRGPLRPLVGSLSVAHSLGVLYGVLSGLAYADERSIVHRDLKPENVMWTDDGRVKIADFGIAKAQDDLASPNLTPPGEFLGAPAYVSPEQVLGSPATAASDLYAVGVIAFELLTGDVPFAGGPSPSTILFRKVEERPPRVRSLHPDLDRALGDWVDSLLERDPERRPSRPHEVLDALEELGERLVDHWPRGSRLPAGETVGTRVQAGQPAAAGFGGVSSLRGYATVRALATHALSRPLAIAVAGGVAAAAALLSPWLFAVAAGSYVALVALTFFDVAEAQSVARRTDAGAAERERRDSNPRPPA